MNVPIEAPEVVWSAIVYGLVRDHDGSAVAERSDVVFANWEECRTLVEQMQRDGTGSLAIEIRCSLRAPMTFTSIGLDQVWLKPMESPR